jgi:hypothetical protein
MEECICWSQMIINAIRQTMRVSYGWQYVHILRAIWLMPPVKQSVSQRWKYVYVSALWWFILCVKHWEPYRDKSMYISRPHYDNINCQIPSLTEESTYMSKPSDHLCSLSESESRWQAQHMTSEHTYWKFLTSLTPSVEKTVNLHGFK